jgi:hypothetical protein
VSPRSRSEWRPARAFRKIRAYSTRRTSTATGVVLLLATIAALGAEALDPTLTGTGYLTAVANHPNRLGVSALLYLVAAGTSVGIALALYPLLRKLNAGLALGAVVFRAIEAVLYTTAVVSLLSLMPSLNTLRRWPWLSGSWSKASVRHPIHQVALGKSPPRGASCYRQLHVRNPPAPLPLPLSRCGHKSARQHLRPRQYQTQAVVGAVVAFALALLIGFGLEQGSDSAVFTALLVRLAVLMIGLKRSRTARR